MGSRIVTTHEALSESYIPQNILHREKELTQLSSAISVVNTFVYGPTGSGKTLLIKKAIQDLNAKSSGMAIYIDCCLYQTTNAIFHEILLSMNTIVSSKSNYALTKRLKERVRRLDHGLSICLDHFERLKEIETVNRLLSLEIKLVIVSDSHETFRKLNSMGKANITNMIEIPNYTVDQASDILFDRTREALEGTAYSDETIRKIAQAGSGNITLALNLLRSQVLKAESEGKNSIDEVEFNFENDCPNDKLSDDERTLIKILKESKSMPGGRLFDFYREQARYPKGKRSFRNYMQDLCLKGLVKNIGDRRGRIYEIVQELG